MFSDILQRFQNFGAFFLYMVLKWQCITSVLQLALYYVVPRAPLVYKHRFDSSIPSMLLCTCLTQ